MEKGREIQELNAIESTENRLRREDYDTAVAVLMGDERNTGRPVGPSAALTAAEGREKKRRAAALENFYLLQLQRQLDALFAERDALYRRLEQIGQERDHLQDSMGRLDEESAVLQRLRESDLGQNPDGSLKDEELEAVMLAYEQRSGQRVDRSDRAAIEAILLRRLAEIERERAELRRRDDELRREGAAVVQKIEKVDEQIDATHKVMQRHGDAGFEERARDNLSAPAQDLQEDIAASLQRVDRDMQSGRLQSSGFALGKPSS